MKLHTNKEEFKALCAVTASAIGIPGEAVKRDYYIVMMLEKLSRSNYADKCVFKGGTSLSKCYPGTINRFSEDIDLTYIPDDELSNKRYSKELKKVEAIMSEDAYIQKIAEERNDRNKSSYVWFEEGSQENTKIKLEIGSSIKPEPYSRRTLKAYIHEYLESKEMWGEVKEFEFLEVELNVLNIERTFLDKVMSVKRHAICETLTAKTRHIYDVVRLYEQEEIKEFLSDKDKLKDIIMKTKNTDSFYLEKRGISKEYDPTGAYAFEKWTNKFNDKEVRKNYENLHKTLLYTDEAQSFGTAEKVFQQISDVFKAIGE
ncbi:MAG: nucleotidyl transferase AbiEii/AbiGii toxin family protein [Bacillota bacterium]|nr:nucleotidyl transferase AbiEii/AbiGii toxin family protein [Bacillota bacterium]